MLLIVLRQLLRICLADSLIDCLFIFEIYQRVYQLIEILFCNGFFVIRYILKHAHHEFFCQLYLKLLFYKIPHLCSDQLYAYEVFLLSIVFTEPSRDLLTDPLISIVQGRISLRGFIVFITLNNFFDMFTEILEFILTFI